MEDFIKVVNESIQGIQQQFDKYQKKNFPMRSPEFFCLELNGEAGELANAEKKNWKGRKIENDVFAEEAADVFIALMNYSNSRGIDLGKSIADKLLKIEKTRLDLKNKGLDY